MGRKSPWNREADLSVIAAIMSGFTLDGVSRQTEFTIHQIGHRLQALRLSFSGGRKAMRQRMTPEQYLDTSPVYRKPDPIQTTLPLTPAELFTQDVEFLIGQITELVIRAERVRDYLVECKKAAA